jgi:hypothetical protein
MSYWVAAVVLVVFGFITGFSIGPPFLLLGLAMLVLGPLRRWPRLFWPSLVGFFAFLVGVIAVIPMTCTATEAIGGASYTVCTSLVGPTWSGSGLYNPPPEAFQLALAVGLAAAALALIATFGWLTVRRRGQAGPPDPRQAD